jgi:hypothetical protein
MTAATLAKIATLRSGDLARRYQPSERVIKALQAAPTADGALRVLLDGDAPEATVELLAHALPKREALWWAATCVRERLPDPAPKGEVQMLEAAEEWVRKPSDEQRRATYALAGVNGMDSPAGVVAAGVFFAGDSLAPAGQQAVPPPGHLVGVMVSNAIKLSAVRQEPQHAPKWLARFVEIGVDIASGGSGRKREG